MIERSRTGVWRIPIGFGYAVGFVADPYPFWFQFARYDGGGWSFAVIWFHFGRKTDRENWEHFDS